MHLTLIIPGKPIDAGGINSLCYICKFNCILEVLLNVNEPTVTLVCAAFSTVQVKDIGWEQRGFLLTKRST